MPEPTEATKETAGMLPRERRVVAVLAGVFSTRMLGLFILFPVLALYADRMPDATPMLVGLSLGAYGVTQAVLQIPFGMLSDRLGRKPVIVAGLAIFFVGSVIAAGAETVLGLIAGRALQGAGAVSAAVTALLADHVRPAARTRAMAVVGGSIGLSFVLSLILGPLATGWIGVDGIFYATAGLAFAAIVMLLLGVPAPVREPVAAVASGGFRAVLADGRLLAMDIGVFLLHFVLTAMFVAAPFVLRDGFAVPVEDHWRTYVVVLGISLTGTIPLILATERARVPQRVMRLGLIVLCAAELILANTGSRFVLWAGGLALFFAVFNFLEARMPARISHLAPADRRGAALGVFASAQFLGAFAGGFAGGLVKGAFGLNGVFYLCAAAAALWWLLDRLLEGNS